jgi:hypothetical protein
MTPTETPIPNGPAAAAILSAAIGCFALGLMTVASDKSKAVNKLMLFYPPSGALTGETTIAIVVWLVAWLVLARLWRNSTRALGPINVASFVLLLCGLLLTFPPFVDVL